MINNNLHYTRISVSITSLTLADGSNGRLAQPINLKYELCLKKKKKL